MSCSENGLLKCFYVGFEIHLYSYKLYTYVPIDNSKNVRVEFIFIPLAIPVIESSLL